MANSILTPTAVTREAQRVLHQKLNFIGSINRQYDSSFAKEGAKIGSQLKIRLPNEYTVRSGATLSAQDTDEISETLAVSTQKGVDLNFTSVDLTMDLDDFSERILAPAMSVLSADLEADAFNMYKDVYNQVGSAGTVPNTWKVLAQGAGKIRESGLIGDDLNACLNVDAHIELSDAVKSLQNPSSQISDAYKKGMIVANAGGFGSVYENTLVPVHTNGSQGGTPLANGVGVSGASTFDVDGVTAGNTWTKGTVFTIAGVNSVHPETKANSGKLQQFVVTSDATFTGGSATVSISPSLDDTGARQKISALPADNAAVTVVGSASTGYAQNLAFHKDAFVFATADLEDVSGYGAWGAREVFDGISLRVSRQYDITNDKVPCRLDVLYGYKTIRPQLASRITA